MTRHCAEGQNEGYESPTVEDLIYIAEFIAGPPGSWHDMMEFVRSRWWLPEWGFRRTKKSYYLSTGGWSGNEQLISALMDNRIFWARHWMSVRAGGHYVFRGIRKTRRES